MNGMDSRDFLHDFEDMPKFRLGLNHNRNIKTNKPKQFSSSYREVSVKDFKKLCKIGRNNGTLKMVDDTFIFGLKKRYKLSGDLEHIVNHLIEKFSLGYRYCRNADQAYGIIKKLNRDNNFKRLITPESDLKLVREIRGSHEVK